MKKLQIILVALISITVLSSFSMQKDKKDKKEKEEINAFELLEGKHYTFEARSMTSQKGLNRNLTTYYSITIEDGKAKGYLPYVGRAHAGTAYGGDGPIQFDGTMEKYSYELIEKKKEKNNRMQIEIIVKGENETYECMLSVSKSGSASLSVRSNNRSSCSYLGSIVAVELAD